MVLIAQLIILGYCVVEALLEYHIIEMKNEGNRKYAYHDSWEHALSAVKFMYVTVCFCLIFSTAWSALFAAPFIRFVAFGGLLNVFRGKSFFYLSRRGIDGWLRHVLGEKAGQFAMVFCIFAIVLINLFL